MSRGVNEVVAGPGGRPGVFLGRQSLRTSAPRRPVSRCESARAASRGAWRGALEATLIHEALHTLGLGENPPTSREITSRVVSRCHR